MRSKTLDKIALKKNITAKVDRSAEEKVKVGDIGVTTTRLALIGYAEINEMCIRDRDLGASV